MFPPMTDEITNEDQVPIHVQSLGSIVRKSKQRVSNLHVDQDDRVLACHVCLDFHIISLIFLR